jgi:altronate dehydratase small subunit
MKNVLLAHDNDNVGNAVEDIGKGDDFAYVYDGKSVQCKAIDDIRFGFKVAVRDIPVNGEILKYNQTVGRASRFIRTGECVHIHNVEGTRGRGDQGGN